MSGGKYRIGIIFLVVASVAGISACGGKEATSAIPSSLGGLRIADELAPELAARAPREYSTGALIYNGTSAAYGGPEAIEAILKSRGVLYHKVNSEQLNAMTLDELSQYGVILWPGGYAGKMSASLTAQARENLRRAVNERGVGFVGFCAGAFIAVSPPAGPLEAGPSWGLAIIPEATLPYYHLEYEGTESAMVKVTLPDGSRRELVWWGGPYLPEFSGGVLARYADTSQPAIIQTWAGEGLVFLTGPHPEAPDSWRTQLNLTDHDGTDQALAWSLIEAALRRRPLEAMN